MKGRYRILFGDEGELLRGIACHNAQHIHEKRNVHVRINIGSRDEVGEGVNPKQLKLIALGQQGIECEQSECVIRTFVSEVLQEPSKPSSQ